MKTFILVAFVLTNVLYQSSYILGSNCTDKRILDGNRLIYSSYEDHKSAYNHISSCTSLKSRQDYACCYIKIKFRNSVSDKKYTHRGCIEISGNEWADIDGPISSIKNNLTSSDVNVTLDKKKVSIDCNSNYLKIAGLLIFALLL